MLLTIWLILVGAFEYLVSTRLVFLTIWFLCCLVFWCFWLFGCYTVGVFDDLLFTSFLGHIPHTLYHLSSPREPSFLMILCVGVCVYMFRRTQVVHLDACLGTVAGMARRAFG